MLRSSSDFGGVAAPQIIRLGTDSQVTEDVMALAAGDLTSLGLLPQRGPMLTWAEFAHARPDLADAGRRLLYQFGVGLGFLATVRADGGPRLHPMCPLVTDEALVGFLQPSPKRDDLHRDGRYALHSFPADANEDAFYLSGRATLVHDRERRQVAAAQFLGERKLTTTPEDFDAQDLFEFYLERCLWTATSGHGDWNPRHTIWRSS
jgi:hypothetical protein